MSLFAERLRQLKEDSGLMLKDISADLDISTPNLSYYMKGREPNYDTLCKFADYFKVTTDYLTGRSNHRNYEAESLAQSIQKEITVDDGNSKRQAEINNNLVKFNELLNKLASLETAENKINDIWEMISVWLDGLEEYTEFLRLNKRPYYPLDEAKKAMRTISESENIAAKNVYKMLKELLNDEKADQTMKDRVIFKSSLGIRGAQNNDHDNEQD